MKGEANNLETSSHTGLQIQEDFALQAREWKVQRTAWLLFGVVVLAGVLGIFGRGLLSGASVTDGDLHVRYERFERLQRPTKIQFQIGANAEETTRVFIDRAYLDAVRIESITPQPEKVVANPGGSIYDFAAAGAPMVVTIYLEMEQFGVVKGQIGRAGGSTLSFKQLVYP
jgi:hypothetical protein